MSNVVGEKDDMASGKTKGKLLKEKIQIYKKKSKVITSSLLITSLNSRFILCAAIFAILRNSYIFIYF